MAQRRMMSKQITETDVFMDLPLSSQALYLHLIMNADDDGFLGNAKTVLRMVGASNDDFKLLIAKQFIIVFDDGITVIKDWRIHNYIQKDRYRSTMYIGHKKELAVDKNQSYQRISGMDTDCIHDVSNPDTQVRLGKDRLEVGKVSKEHSAAGSTPLAQLESEFDEVWSQYPNKKGKKQALGHYKAWRKKSVKHTNAYLLERLRLYKQELANTKWKSPMNGSTWFNGRFDDDYSTLSKQRANSFALEGRDVTEDDLPW